MIIVVKVLERRGNSTFWHVRTCLFFGSPCDSTIDHSYQLTEILTTVGKRKWKQRVSHCTINQVFGIILKSMRNTAFLNF